MADPTTDDVTAREFTPSMQRLRDEYVQMRAEHYGFADLYAAEFDRALAQHDARVRAQAAPDVDLTAAVEAAARAWFDRGQAERRDAGRFRPDGQLWQWEDLRPIDQHACRTLVLPIVTATVKALAGGDE